MNRRNVGLVWGMTALGFLFASCEKEISEKAGEGERVEIFFSINTTGYNAEDQVVRNGAVREPVTTDILLEDDLFLRATLMPDPAAELRVDAPFLDGQKIRFMAYDIADSSNPVDSKVYSYSTSAGKFIPDTDPLGVVPNDGTVYRFVAYSYFGESGVDPDDDATIDPAHDLVWGKTAADQTITDTEASRTVTIHMTHQFAQVMVQVKSGIAGANIAYLNNVGIEGGQLGTLTPFDGSMGWSGTATQDMGISGNYSTNEVNSGYRTVKPVSPAPAKVKLGNVRVSTNGTTFNDRIAEFNSTLNAAASYLLLVELRRVAPFAYSNIVWDGSKLTFATTAAENATIPQESMGVFFKWGSLVAIAVLGGDFTAGQYPSGHILFSPNGNYNYTFPNVPYANETSAPFDNSIDEDDLVTFGSGAGYDVAADKGDICRYISSQGWVSGSWRMPRNSDFSTLIYTSAVTNGGFDQTLPTGTEAAYGRAQQIMGINFAAGLFMPASSRLFQVNPLYPNSYYIYAPDVGRRAMWMGASSWADSLSDNNDPTKHFLVLSIAPSYAYSGLPTATAARALFAFNVRCVKN